MLVLTFDPEGSGMVAGVTQPADAGAGLICQHVRDPGQQYLPPGDLVHLPVSAEDDLPADVPGAQLPDRNVLTHRMPPASR